MATEFTVKFEGDISQRFAAQVNAAIQSAVLDLVAHNFPNPDDDEPRHPHPGGPVEGVVAESIRIKGIIFRPNLSLASQQ